MTGIGRYLLDLLKYIPATDDNAYYLFSYRGATVVNERFVSIPTAPRFVSSKLYSPFWLLKVLPKYLKQHEIDVLFSPNFFAPPKQKSTKWKSIILVCDTFLQLREQYHSSVYSLYAKSLLQRSVKESDAIVTISQHSKTDIIRSYGATPEKIFVIYPSAGQNFNTETLGSKHRQEISQRFGLPLQFILYVGVIELRKNILGITRIADELKRRNVNVPIVLVGRPGFGFEKIMREVSARGNIRYVSYVEEEFLPEIYRMASVFIFPSHYEGFGIPPLEAMQSGVPVVVSDTSSIPEVVGEAASMFPPDDALGFANEIIRLLENKEYHEKRRQSGILQAAKFSAHDSAAALVQLFSLISS